MAGIHPVLDEDPVGLVSRMADDRSAPLGKARATQAATALSHHQEAQAPTSTGLGLSLPVP